MIWVTLLRHSQRFAGRGAYYRGMALLEGDPRHADTLFGISALFLEMAAHAADREKASSDEVTHTIGGLRAKWNLATNEKPSIRTFTPCKPNGTELIHEQPI